MPTGKCDRAHQILKVQKMQAFNRTTKPEYIHVYVDQFASFMPILNI